MRLPPALNQNITPAEGERQVHKTVCDMKIQLHRWIGVAVAWLGITSASAYDFKVDGIYYDINADETTVSVTYKTENSYASSYSGEVAIPQSVTYNKKNYSVTNIGERAFYLCSGLTSITIPESMASIGNQAFSNCTGLTSIIIPESVTSIGYQAFLCCTSLTSIIIPESVTTIGSEAFSYCTGLTEVIIPNSVTTIGGGAFEGCTGLTGVTIGKSVTTIGSSAFNGCDGLTEVIIPESVANIEDYAFSECDGLQSIVVAEGNTSYSSSEGVLFNKDKTVLIQYPGGKSGAYVIPSSVTSIEHYAFRGCTGLTEVTIPESMTTIEWSAFQNCTGLTSVTIPESVTSIGDLAFYNCDLLETIKSYATIPPAIEANTFSSYDATLYVPVDCGEAYREAEYWANFTNIVESIDSRVEALQDENIRVYTVDNTLHVENGGKIYQVYTLAGQLVYTGNGTTVPLTNTGVYIVHMGDYIQKVIVR